MNRDGARKSLWQNEIVSFEKPLLLDEYDVLIVGGGITGLTCAINLQKTGKKCILLEAYNIGFGTTGGTTAHINTFFDTSYDVVMKKFNLENAQLLAQAAIEARNEIKNNCLAYSPDAEYKEKSAFLIALDEQQSETLESIWEASNEVGIQMNKTTDCPIPIPHLQAVTIPGQAQFHPIKYIKGLAQSFVRNGGHIYQDCRMLEYENKGEYLNIITNQGTLRAGNLIYATHTPPGVNILHFCNAPYRSYAMAVKLKSGYPDALTYDLSDPYHYYRTHIIDGTEYLIAGGEDHKTGHTEDTGECFMRLESYVRQHFEVDVVTHMWSSQYYEPVDGLPYIGNLPGAEKNVFVATGYSGNGMTFGTLAGRILCDVISSGKSKYENLFNPARIKPVAGFTNFVKEGADVVASFVKDKLFAQKLQSLADLQPGEAKTVKYEGSWFALYKDDRHRLHALNSTCPHVYCNVHWNSAEKTWDCPCHGSRFKLNGDVINAPSVKGLEKVDLTDLDDQGSIRD